MDVITVHGIRRQNRWNESLESLESIKANNIKINPFDFGFFGFLKFLWPFSREAIIDQFCSFYSQHYGNGKNPPSIIAHSFGTYIVYMAMKRYPHIKFNTIIFCGSILNTNTDFRTMISQNQFKKLYNDHGSREWYLKITRIAVNKYCGKAGRNGFLDIPKDKSGMIINRNNYLRHSDYFLEDHMDKSWVSELIRTKINMNYKPKILRKVVIDRIYDNINNSDYPFSINEINFNARIDKHRNYYAKTEKVVVNETEFPIDSYSFTTSADSTNEASEMNMFFLDNNNNRLAFEIENDVPNLKTIKVTLHKPMKPKESIVLRNYFSWDKTIVFTGDTDHWAIKGVRNISIRLNFPHKLINPRIYIITNNDIIEQHALTLVIEKDKTFTYEVFYDNKYNYDGIVFYFEGVSNHEIQNTKKQKKHKNGQTIQIDKVNNSEIVKIFDIEKLVELTNAASHDVLINRLNTFNDGFLSVKVNSKIVGYIESLIWNEKPFETFSEISNFPMHYNVRGDSLYVIFLAVHPNHRKKGYAKLLLNEIEKISSNFKIKRISLVAKDDLINFYKKFGYQEVRELPDFLKGRAYKSVLMEKRITFHNNALNEQTPYLSSVASA